MNRSLVLTWWWFAAALGCAVAVGCGGGDTKAPTSPDGGAASGDATNGDATSLGSAVLEGYWVWEKRVEGTVEQSGPIDKGQMKIAFGTGNNKCHYIWNETTGSDFHTECSYAVSADMATLTAPADPDKTAAGYSCAHPDWTNWNDRPAVQYSRFRFKGDRLWMGVNSHWGGVSGGTHSAKRFPFWESQGQAETLESWIVFKRVTRAEWYGTYAISTGCQGTAALCAKWPGCGAGDKRYVD